MRHSIGELVLKLEQGRIVSESDISVTGLDFEGIIKDFICRNRPALLKVLERQPLHYNLRNVSCQEDAYVLEFEERDDWSDVQECLKAAERIRQEPKAMNEGWERLSARVKEVAAHYGVDSVAELAEIPSFRIKRTAMALDKGFGTWYYLYKGEPGKYFIVVPNFGEPLRGDPIFGNLEDTSAIAQNLRPHIVLQRVDISREFHKLIDEKAKELEDTGLSLLDPYALSLYRFQHRVEGPLHPDIFKHAIIRPTEDKDLEYTLKKLFKAISRLEPKEEYGALLVPENYPKDSPSHKHPFYSLAEHTHQVLSEAYDKTTQYNRYRDDQGNLALRDVSHGKKEIMDQTLVSTPKANYIFTCSMPNNFRLDSLTEIFTSDASDEKKFMQTFLIVHTDLIELGSYRQGQEPRFILYSSRDIYEKAMRYRAEKKELDSARKAYKYRSASQP
ncbi:MAG: hypothetical protein KJ709_00200 [Nanoarchaeota archaeon]|nr:hypothetical protein [Nanoarchaeota archaeon]